MALSYVTVPEADAYFETRLDVAAWTDAPETEKFKALVTATSFLDSLKWSGYSEDSGQDLRFPCTGTYFEERFGTYEAMSPTPKRILLATMELAYHFLNNDGILDETGSVISLQVSSINLNTIVTPNKMPKIVKDLIKPMLSSDGRASGMWWRAN